MRGREGWRMPVVCVASGPSLDSRQTAAIEMYQKSGLCRVLVVSDNYRRLPHADALYAADYLWWQEHARALRNFEGERWTIDRTAAQRWGLFYVECYTSGNGLHVSPLRINGGGNSGYQAVNLAYHFGATKIVLAGYDMQRTYGQAHWFGDHPEGLRNDIDESLLITWRSRFQILVEDLALHGVPVLNATRETALNCAPRVTLAEALQ